MTQQGEKFGKDRSISQIVDAKTTTEGDGFTVHRAFPNNVVRDFDPFLLLDEMGPIDLSPGEAKGASDHPHLILIEVLKLLHMSLMVLLSTKILRAIQEN
jgi:redox-sensitive bicupin YhaK (pirin superfamily)